MAATSGNTDMFTSRFAFLMASVGFAVGLGNIWRFPYVAGENGGAAFVLVYLACAFGIGVPVLMAELMIGRRGNASPPRAVANVAELNQSTRAWSGIGFMGVAAGYTIGLVYAGIVGWVLWYLFKAISTGFVGVDAVSAAADFAAVQADTPAMLGWTLLGLVIAGLIIYSGVEAGIERAVGVMMPLMFLLLLGLAAYNIFAGGFREAVVWLFSPDFSKIGPDAVLAALGQAFFSIGVAMGGMMIYGAYLPRDISIGGSVLFIIFADTLVAVLAGLVIFPAVFANGLDPAGGPGLIFQTLPVAFASMPGGWAFSILFFLMLAVAGITSMLGLVECVNVWLEEKFDMPRHRSVLVVVGSQAALSIVSLMSYNTLADLEFGAGNYNETLDFLSSQILLPLGGLLIAVFAGWVMHPDQSRDELHNMGDGAYALWRFLVRYIVPPALLVIFYMGVTG